MNVSERIHDFEKAIFENHLEKLKNAVSVFSYQRDVQEFDELKGHVRNFILPSCLMIQKLMQ